jgi:hypothetical protein
MFSFFDRLFSEERTKDQTARDFGIKESQWLQRAVRKDELDSPSGYSEEEVSQAVVHTREDLVLIVSQLQRTNIILRWIRFLLAILLITLWVKF